MFEEMKGTLRLDPVELLTRSHLADRFEEVRRLKGAVAVYEARLVSATDRLGDQGVDGAGMLRSAGRMSSKAASVVAKTAAGLEDLPCTAEALGEGRITIEHAAAVAVAAEHVSPERADAELVESAAAAPADVFAKRSREWSTRNRSDDGGEERVRQRRNREARHWIGDDGMWMFLQAFDAVTGATVKARHDAVTDTLWRADGGRDGCPDEIRTPAQRSADAFAQLLTQDAAPDGKVPHPKFRVTAVYDINDTTSPDGTPLATLVADGQPLPQAVLDEIAADSVITPMIFNGPSRPIWVGRPRCAPDRCEAHHIRTWADGGHTDIDNLVLLCTRCHHNIHNRNMTLRRTNNTWHIEPHDRPQHIHARRTQRTDTDDTHQPRE